MPVPALVIVEMPSLEGIARASEQELMDLARRWARARRTIDAGLAMLAGQIAARSTPELGYDGMAQRSGARTPDALVAQLTGTTAAEAGSLAAMGRIMEEHAPWLAPVVSEVAGGRMSVASADAIRRGLGSPGADVAPDDLIDAARSLVDEAAAEGLSPERLGRRAREARDELDAAGVADRERRLRERRSLRLIPQSDGMTRIAALLDPESAAIVTAAVDQVTSPRRGGPRFVDSAERARTQLLADDERSTEQLALDALVDMVRIAGAADEGRLLGARQPTVHIHVDADELEAGDGTSGIEGQTVAVLSATARRWACADGYRPIVFRDGQPLRLGRGQRLFTSAQRAALAARWGGARWIAASDPRRGPRPITSGSGSAITAPPTSPTASSCADITICFCTTTAGASGIAARSW